MNHDDNEAPDTPPSNYWTEREARDDVSRQRCIHGVPFNVFCDKCEA